MNNTQDALSVGVIILAAGASSRLGQPKQLLAFEGQSLLRRVCLAALASRLSPVVVVLGANENLLRSEIEDLPLQIASNPDWQAGLSQSVRAGLDALEEQSGIRAIVIAPCDQPLLDAGVFNRLLDAHANTGCAIAVSSYADIWGTPMLFERALWPELRALSGDRGAQKVARRHAERVECVPFPGGAFDVDTRADYEALDARLPFDPRALSPNEPG